MPEVWTNLGVVQDGFTDDADMTGYAQIDSGQLAGSADGYPYTDTTTGAEPAQYAGEHTYVSRQERVLGREEHGVDFRYRTGRPDVPANTYAVDDQQDVSTMALSGLDIGQPPTKVVTPGADVWNATQVAVGTTPVKLVSESNLRTKVFISNTDQSAVSQWSGILSVAVTASLPTTIIPIGQGQGPVTIQGTNASLTMNGLPVTATSSNPQVLQLPGPSQYSVRILATTSGTVVYSYYTVPGQLYIGNQSSINASGIGSISVPAGATLTRTNGAEVWAVSTSGVILVNVETEQSKA